MFFSLRFFVCILLSAFFLYGYGCTTKSLGINQSDTITSDKVSSIRVGVSSLDDLKQLFGEPEFNHKDQGSWAVFFKDINLASLWIELDDNSLVKKVKVRY